MNPPSVTPRLSVVIPTYERPERVARLVLQLAEQTLSPAAFEVIVVDDGSRADPRPQLAGSTHPFHLEIVRQTNQGAAAARHRGVELARGEIVLFLDDDMIPSPSLAELHLAAHDATPRAVVMGRIKPSREIQKLSLFERYHARKLEDFSATLRDTGRAPRGTELCTGNLSMRRADYLAVGGFDRTLGRSEDMELGLRLEKAGAVMRYCDDAWTVHDSDHTSAASWLQGAFVYGVSDQRIARKHPDAPHASPWHYLDIVSALPKPAYALAIAAPAAGHLAARAVMGLAAGLDALGLEKPALAGTMLAYGIEYYRGVRSEVGSATRCARDLRSFRAARRAAVRGSGKPRRRPHLPPGARKAAFSRFLAAVRADHEMLQRGDAKYDKRGRAPASLGHDLVERIGFQMLAAIRLMQFLHEGGSPLAAKVAARTIRLIYGADVHWNAKIEPGIAINHGMGLAIGHAARIAKGVILSHNVGIGDGIDPKTHLTGHPIIEEDVHIGPGALVLGPITIGAGSKIGPNAVVMQSIPPGSVVEAPPPNVRPRARKPGAAPPVGPPRESAATESAPL